MVLGWLGGGRETDVDALIAAKKFDKALALIRTQLETRKTDSRLRLQLADVLAKAGRGAQAVPVLLEVADEFARCGFAAKAIALLKKAQRIEPGRVEVEEKLAALLKRPGMEARRNDPSITLPGIIGLPPPPPTEPAPRLAEEAFREDIMGVIEDVLRPVTMDDHRAAVLASGPEMITSPLFGDFGHEELLAVIRGLRLLTAEPGDVIVTEGERGSSLFVLATGTVKAFVRNLAGRNLPVRELRDGDFFGEISILKAGPRTASVTAATHCELLELDRRTLDVIMVLHPRVHWVLEQFAEQRSNSSIEAAIRSMEISS